MKARTIALLALFVILAVTTGALIGLDGARPIVVLMVFLGWTGGWVSAELADIYWDQHPGGDDA